MADFVLVLVGFAAGWLLCGFLMRRVLKKPSHRRRNSDESD
jgi:uncharacterized membrane protein YciS (DUF1049 family)